MHVVLLGVNEALLDNFVGDDAAVLRTLGEGLDRLSVIVVTRQPREPLALSDRVTILPVCARSRAAGVLALRREVIALHAASPIDILQAQEPAYTGVAALLAARATGAKFGVGVFGADPHDRRFRAVGRSHQAAALVMRGVLARADLVQTDSREIEHRLGQHYPRVRYKPMTPLTLDTFLRVGAARQIRPGSTRLLFVGRLARQKRPSLLIDSFDRARRNAPELDLTLTIVGSGPDETWTRGETERLGLASAVTFLGVVPYADLPDVYADADVFVLTSHYEGFPRVFLEAAAAALPIVSTPVAGAFDLRNDDGPVLIADPDPGAVADALVELARDPDRRERIGAALREALNRRLAEPSPPEQQLAIWRELTS